MVSLSARRVWIEIIHIYGGAQKNGWSLSARRVWIEIKSGVDNPRRHRVALRKESVDRNLYFLLSRHLRSGRSPQGECG